MKAIRAGLVIDGTQSAPVEGATILIQGGSIREVVPDIDAAVSEETEVIDASSSTVIPGMVDLHVHLRNPDPRDVPAGERYRFRIETEPSLAVFYAAHAAQITMQAGFTTLRTMGGIEYVALRKAIDARLVPGPRVLVSGMVVMTGGHTDRTLPTTLTRAYPYEAWKGADGVDEVRKTVRELARAGADFVKFDAGGGLHYPDVYLYSEPEIRAIVDEAHNFGLHVAAHAHGREAILRAVRAGADTLEHGTFADDACIEEMQKHKTTFVPTLAILHDTICRGAEWGYSDAQLSRYRELQEIRMKAVGRAHAAGVRIALGTDSSGWLAPHGRNGVEFGLLRDAGLDPEAALAAGTSAAARAIGLQKLIGTLEPGKRADLVILKANPLHDIDTLSMPENILAVWRDGELTTPHQGPRS